MSSDTFSVEEVLAQPGLQISVAKSMLAAVLLGKTHEVSPYLWMKLLNTYIELAEAAVDRAIEDYAASRPAPVTDTTEEP